MCTRWPDSLVGLRKGDERERKEREEDGAVWFRLKEREAINARVNRFLLKWDAHDL